MVVKKSYSPQFAMADLKSSWDGQAVVSPLSRGHAHLQQKPLRQAIVTSWRKSVYESFPPVKSNDAVENEKTERWGNSL